MKTINVNIELFQYDELNLKAKEKAFDEHFNFLCSVAEDGETEEELYNSVEESIKINEYWFFNNGKIANCTTYTAGEKKGITEFKIYGKVYEVTI